jgi:hypothetical protein
MTFHPQVINSHSFPSATSHQSVAPNAVIAAVAQGIVAQNQAIVHSQTLSTSCDTVV